MSDKKQVSIYLTPEQIKVFKIAAIEEELTVTAFIEKVVTQYLKAKEQKKMTIYAIRGRASGKTYQVELDERTGAPDEGFMNYFYESDEEPEIKDGFYMVDDESIAAYFADQITEPEHFPPLKVTT